MPYQIMLRGLVVASLLLNAHSVHAKNNRSRFVALIPRVTKEAPSYSVSRWFREFDQIEVSGLLPLKQRERGALLMMRAFAGVSEPAEIAEGHGLLIQASERYRKTAERIARLPPLQELDAMRGGYVNFYEGLAKLSDDCAALQTADIVRMRFRRLSSQEVALLVKRKHLLDQLLATCRCAELKIRTAHRLPFDKDAKCEE